MVANPGMFTMKVVGSNRVAGNLRRVGSSLDAVLDDIAEFLAEDMADAAYDLVAKDEWKVAKSIRTESRDGGWSVIADRGGDRDEAAVYLELGTHKMAPRPYMVPAFRLVLASGGLLKATKAAGGLLGQTGGRGL